MCRNDSCSGHIRIFVPSRISSSRDCEIFHPNTMNTPETPPTPVMTLDETCFRIRKLANDNTLTKLERIALQATLHHLESGKRQCSCEAFRAAQQHGTDNEMHGSLISKWDDGQFHAGFDLPVISFCPWCGGALSPQPSQQPSPPAPYYTAYGKPLQYHEVSGGGGCGAIPVEPPKQSPQT